MSAAILAARWAIPTGAMGAGGRSASLVTMGALSYLAVLRFGYRPRLPTYLELARRLGRAREAAAGASA